MENSILESNRTSSAITLHSVSGRTNLTCICVTVSNLIDSAALGTQGPSSSQQGFAKRCMFARQSGKLLLRRAIDCGPFHREASNAFAAVTCISSQDWNYFNATNKTRRGRSLPASLNHRVPERTVGAAQDRKGCLLWGAAASWCDSGSAAGEKLRSQRHTRLT